MVELTLASWRLHRRRYVATSLAVFLGVAFCSAALSLTAAARQGAADAVALRSHPGVSVNDLTHQVDVMGRFVQASAVVSLFVAGLVIANTFRIVMTQRIRDFALLRCVGAERSRVFTLSLGEAALLGVCAAAVGTGAGLGLTAVLVGAAGATSVGVPLAFVAPGASILMLPFVGGVLTTVVAAVSPVWRASRVSPLAALNPATEISARDPEPSVTREQGVVTLPGLHELAVD